MTTAELGKNSGLSSEQAKRDYSDAQGKVISLQNEVDSFFSDALPTKALENQLKATQESVERIDLTLNANLVDLRNRETERKRRAIEEKERFQRERNQREPHYYNNENDNRQLNRGYGNDRRDNDQRINRDRYYDDRSYAPLLYRQPQHNGYHQEVNLSKRPQQQYVYDDRDAKRFKR